MTPIRGRAWRSALGGGAADTLRRTENELASCGAGPRGWSRLLGSSTPTREICKFDQATYLLAGPPNSPTPTTPPAPRVRPSALQTPRLAHERVERELPYL